ncbi:MAG: ABC-type spermidine/putrescine transport system, ATPase component [Planctomycetota bacterium]|nr:ABC-type spermidine/putrescine transport system, ATPase component [Planctomycetota bacterium]
MIRVTFDGLTKTFDGVSAVDGASLDVAPGERMVILGPSGAGKTALARLIVGLEEPDSGEIRFDGRSLSGLPVQGRKIGYVPREDALWPHRTVAENVGYRLKVQGIGRRERRMRVGEALGAARIDSLADRHPDSLTPLQRQKVALARALIGEPDLLVWDEPVASLDARHRIEFRDEIRRVHTEHETTTILLTSDPREALALADRVAVLDFGKIVQVGTPIEVYNRPADSFVAQLLGPTNLLQGQADSCDARGEVVVRTPIGRLIGKPSGDSPSPGTPVTVAIRPESLAIGPAVPPDSNRFLATIERQVLLGATRQLFLRGPNEWPITALALQAQSDGLRDGQSLTVSVAPEFVVLLPSKAAARPS